MARLGFTNTSARKARAIILPVILLTAALVTAYLAVSRGTALFRERTASATRSFSELWDQGLYSQVASIAEKELESDPLNRDALLFAGYSRYFTAVSRLSEEERNGELDAAIAHLRLLKARGGTPSPERVDYILGKSYLLKGSWWSDLALRYLTQSLEGGYYAEDSYEYLGRASSALGDVEGALNWYERAAESHPTDRLLLTLGSEAFKLGLYDKSAEYYQRSIEITRDDSLKKRGLSQLGQLYYDVGNYLMAKTILERLTDMGENEQDDLFLLGETYHELGMASEARSAWHSVVRINPGHVGALRRLYD